jgi:hypothetical protein
MHFISAPVYGIPVPLAKGKSSGHDRLRIQKTDYGVGLARMRASGERWAPEGEAGRGQEVGGYGPGQHLASFN